MKGLNVFTNRNINIFLKKPYLNIQEPAGTFIKAKISTWPQLKIKNIEKEIELPTYLLFVWSELDIVVP